MSFIMPLQGWMIVLIVGTGVQHWMARSGDAFRRGSARTE
jgi:hypothetical protein